MSSFAQTLPFFYAALVIYYMVFIIQTIIFFIHLSTISKLYGWKFRVPSSCLPHNVQKKSSQPATTHPQTPSPSSPNPASNNGSPGSSIIISEKSMSYHLVTLSTMALFSSYTFAAACALSTRMVGIYHEFLPYSCITGIYFGV